MPTDTLLDAFLRGLAPLRPLALWAHGSLAGGDYQEGRSDLDLVAVLPGPLGLGRAWRVAALHTRLRAAGPLAAKLHCSYLTPQTLADPERRHLTWAHNGLMRRSVTPVTRRELHDFGRVCCTARCRARCCRRYRTSSSTASSSATSGTSGGRRWTGPGCGGRTSGSTWAC
ncbi:hypothetical protein GCM10010501_48880 [Streptomyces libani subsp. rufus]|nr:hypothetical protein GCM10010501_48880 [Streptomyces libani subsp. rufus]